MDGKEFYSLYRPVLFYQFQDHMMPSGYFDFIVNKFMVLGAFLAVVTNEHLSEHSELILQVGFCLSLSFVHCINY